MRWYFQALRKYAVFGGRARRREYWTFELFNVLIVIALFVLDFKLGTIGEGVGLLSGVYLLAVFLPSLASLVRRLHDTGRSAWWIFINLVPLFGPISILIFTFEDSQPGENRYGPSPKLEGIGLRALEPE